MWYKSLKFVLQNQEEENHITKKSLLNSKEEVNKLYNKHYKIIDDIIMKLYGSSYRDRTINYPKKNHPQIIQNIHRIGNIETQIKDMTEYDFSYYLQGYLNNFFTKNSKALSKTHNELLVWYQSLKFLLQNQEEKNYITEKSLLNRKYEMNGIYNKHYKFIDSIMIHLYLKFY